LGLLNRKRFDVLPYRLDLY